MKKKKYRLNTVIEIRREGKKAASVIVHKRREELEAEEEELASRERTLSSHREIMSAAGKRMQNDLSDGTAASKIVSHKTYLENLREKEQILMASVKEQRESVALAAGILDEAIQNLAEASKELSVIEKHKEKWKNSEQKRQTKQEQKLMDEISSILHKRSEKL
ncbi:MAG: hypothetical protein HKN33_04365 [Pyrinomonadaceae bacterium]|nr:hypothetical protein [Pyrinomonadaceae bacterium]